MEYHGISWNIMEYHGISWKSDNWSLKIREMAGDVHIFYTIAIRSRCSHVAL